MVKPARDYMNTENIYTDIYHSEIDIEKYRNDLEKTLRKTFKHDLVGRFEKAVVQYRLVEEGDRIAVCISGGKDSMLMAKLFQELKRHNKFPFSLVFLSIRISDGKPSTHRKKRPAPRHPVRIL